MTDARITQAVARIDAALARIEMQASHRPAPGAVFDAGPSSSGDVGLVARHETLRDTVEETLRDLDRLIEGLER